MENISEVYVINLKNATERMQHIHDNLTTHNIAYTRWEATNGSDMRPEEVQANTSKLCRNILCNNGTIGCYMSHLLLWHHIATTSPPHNEDPSNTWFIILEDDAMVLPGFTENLKHVFEDLESWPMHQHAYPEIIHLACMPFCNKIHITKHVYTLSFFKTTRGYLLSLSAARKLASLMNNIHFHIDVMFTLNNALGHKLAIYSTKCYISNNDKQDSFIGALTFPQSILQLIIYPIIIILGLSNNTLHIFFKSPIISMQRKIDINITFIPFVFLLALFAHLKRYDIILLILLFEFTLYSFLWLHKSMAQKNK